MEVLYFWSAQKAGVGQGLPSFTPGRAQIPCCRHPDMYVNPPNPLPSHTCPQESSDTSAGKLPGTPRPCPRGAQLPGGPRTHTVRAPRRHLRTALRPNRPPLPWATSPSATRRLSERRGRVQASAAVRDCAEEAAARWWRGWLGRRADFAPSAGSQHSGWAEGPGAGIWTGGGSWSGLGMEGLRVQETQPGASPRGSAPTVVLAVAPAVVAGHAAVVPAAVHLPAWLSSARLGCGSGPLAATEQPLKAAAGGRSSA